jgi:SET domain-containing protein
MQEPEPYAIEKMRECLRNWRGGREGDFVVVQHPERGRCVVTTHEIKSGVFVMEYEGKFMTREKADKWDQLYEHEKYGCFIVDATWENQEVSIDGTQKYGTIGRLVNHAGVRPNLKPYGLLVVEPNQSPRLALYSARAIKTGEELFWNYGPHTNKFPWGNFTCPRGPYEDLTR